MNYILLIQKYQYDNIQIGLVVVKLFGSALRLLRPGLALLDFIQHFPPWKPYAGTLFESQFGPIEQFPIRQVHCRRHTT